MFGDLCVCLVVREFPELGNMLMTAAEFGNSVSHLHLGDGFGARGEQPLIPLRYSVGEQRSIAIVERNRFSDPAVVPPGCVFRTCPVHLRQARQKGQGKIMDAVFCPDAENFFKFRNVLPVDRCAKSLQDQGREMPVGGKRFPDGL